MRGNLSTIRVWLIATVVVVIATATAVSQPYTNNVGIGTNAPDPSALLELRANDKGFLITRMSQPERDLISLPATGLMIYNTTSSAFQYNIGTPQAPIWVSMLYINIDGGSSSGVFWSLLGNDSVDRAVNFLGTTNAQPLIIKTDNVRRAAFTETGFFDISANTTINGTLNLLGDTTTLMMNFDVGRVGNPLISQGPGRTPQWFPLISFTDTLTQIDTRLRVTEKAVFDSLPQMPLRYGHVLVGDSNDIAVPLSPGLEGSLFQINLGYPTWVTPDQANYWSLDGNANADANSRLGTLGPNDLNIVTNDALRMVVTAAGQFNINIPTFVTGGLSLVGPNTPLSLDGNDGVAGQVMISQGAGLTPKYTDTLTLARLTVTGESNFQGQADFTLLPRMPLQRNFLLVGDSNNLASPFAPGADSSFLAIENGNIVWFDLGRLLRNTAWIVGGNYGVGSSILGNMDTVGIRDVDLRANSQTYFFLNATSGSSDVRRPLNLDGSNIELQLQGSPGVAGQVLISQGAGVTPKYTDSLTLASLTVLGEATFQDTAEFVLFPKIPLQSGFIIVGDSTNLAKPFPPGLEGSLMQIQLGVPTWVTPDQANYWSLSGNAGVGPTAYIGTSDANDLNIATNGALRMIVTATGQLNINVPTFVVGGLSLVGPNTPFNLDGNDGVAGQVVVSQGPGLTPKYTDTLTLSNLTVTGTSLFQGQSEFTLLPKMPLQENYLLLGDSTNSAAPFAPGADSTFLAVVNGDVVWFDLTTLLKNTAWIVGGNQGVSSPILGNMDTVGIRDVDIRANAQSFFFLDAASGTSLVRKPLNLEASNTPLLLQGNAGVAGQVLVSQGAGVTPKYTDSLTLASLTVTGESFFQDTAEFSLLPKFPLQSGYMLVGDSTNWVRALPPGLEGSVMQIQLGVPTWVSPDQSAYWSLSGNSGVGPTAFLGTTDANDLNIATNGALRMIVTATGQFNINIPTFVVGGLSLVGANTPFNLNGTDGVAGQVLVSDGPGLTPRYTDSLTLATLTVTGTSLFQGQSEFTLLPKMPLQENYLVIGDSTGTLTPFQPGSDSTFLAVINGDVTWFDLSDLLNSNDWAVGGNLSPSSPVIGNLDSTGAIRDLDVTAGGRVFLRLDGTTYTANVRQNLNLEDSDVELQLQGDPGQLGQVLISQGAGLTPRYTDTLTLSSLTVTGESFFKDTAEFDVFMKFPLQYGHMIVGDSLDRAQTLPPGLEGSLLQINLGVPQWVSPDQSAYWSLSGNSGVGSTAFLGTTDANDLRIVTNGALRVNVSATNGDVTVSNMAGTPSLTPLAADDGLVVADVNGTLSKRDKSALFAAFGLASGRYNNAGAAPENTVVITLPPGFVLDPNAAIILTPEATVSVSATPFVIANSRTATTFSISFPGGLNPGEAINWMVKNP